MKTIEERSQEILGILKLGDGCLHYMRTGAGNEYFADSSEGRIEFVAKNDDGELVKQSEAHISAAVEWLLDDQTLNIESDDGDERLYKVTAKGYGFI